MQEDEDILVVKTLQYTDRIHFKVLNFVVTCLCNVLHTKIMENKVLPDQFHQRGRMVLDHTSEWQKSKPGLPRTSDLLRAGSFLSSQHFSL